MFTGKNIYTEGMSLGHVFVLTDSKNEPKNRPCWCKDYFQDYFFTQFTKIPVNIFGYSTKVEELDKTYRFYIKLGTKNQMDGNDYLIIPLDSFQRKRIRLFLENLAEYIGLSVPVCDTEQEFYVEFNSDWFERPYLLSLLTSAIRIGTWISFNEFLDSWKNIHFMKLYVHDLRKDIFESVQSKVKYLKEKGIQDIPWTDYNKDSIHNYSGIQSVKFK